MEMDYKALGISGAISLAMGAYEFAATKAGVISFVAITLIIFFLMYPLTKEYIIPLFDSMQQKAEGMMSG